MENENNWKFSSEKTGEQIPLCFQRTKIRIRRKVWTENAINNVSLQILFDLLVLRAWCWSEKSKYLRKMLLEAHKLTKMQFIKSACQVFIILIKDWWRIEIDFVKTNIFTILRFLDRYRTKKSQNCCSRIFFSKHKSRKNGKSETKSNFSESETNFLHKLLLIWFFVGQEVKFCFKTVLKYERIVEKCFLGYETFSIIDISTRFSL